MKKLHNAYVNLLQYHCNHIVTGVFKQMFTFALNLKKTNGRPEGNIRKNEVLTPERR